jgi:type IV secretory pathway VirB10-like protein
VTMEVMKYIVYEQAEEVNEEWIAHKEPSEFMDEVVIVIYKEGEAPPEVLEDVNKAELPDEIRGQQQALQQQRQKAEQIRAQRLRMEQTKLANMQHNKMTTNNSGGDGDDNQDAQDDEEEDFAALNTQKRDRRTIEDFEREAKRRKGE